jgi:UDP-3-O-[3-hydroxymyristoyl] glucosamine N-acyltransferase
VIFRLAELAELVAGTVQGDPERTVEGLRALEDAGPRDLSLLTQRRYRKRAAASRAGALLVAPALADAGDGKDLVVVDDPAEALARLLPHFYPLAAREPGIHPTALVESGCAIDPTAHLGPYAVVGAGSTIAARAAVLAHAVVGRGCAVGEGAVIHPGAVLYDRTEIGPGSVVHAGAVLGADGFGYATRQGVHQKVPQVGRLVVGREVEIGALTAIDRGTLGATRIGAGTKIDNLVQIGHNVEVGKGCILCGQVGIAGSARLGDYVVFAGQVGMGDHLEAGDGAQVAGQGGIMQSLAAGGKYSGTPAIEVGKWRRQVALLSRLGEIYRRLRALEKRLPRDGPEDGEGGMK